MSRATSRDDGFWFKCAIFYIVIALVAGAMYFVLHSFWGDKMVMNIDDVLGRGLVWEGVLRVWPLYVWGIVFLTITLVYKTSTGEGRPVSPDNLFVRLAKGLYVSIFAGVFEEIIYRLFLFLSAMVMVQFFNFITFGLVKWLSVHLSLPVVNFLTFHALEPQLIGGGWVLGTAILIACSRFSSAHEHSGLFAQINSWCIGMVLFWLMFHYGLLTAIVVHGLYDLILLSYAALVTKRGSVLPRGIVLG